MAKIIRAARVESGDNWSLVVACVCVCARETNAAGIELESLGRLIIFAAAAWRRRPRLAARMMEGENINSKAEAWAVVHRISFTFGLN